MGKNIRISPQHGLNPSMSHCFFCGEPKGDLLLLGKLKGDVKAPKGMIVDYKPCKACAEKQAKGTTVIEVTTAENGMLPIQGNLHPTGRWFIMKKEVASSLFNCTNNTILLEDKAFEQIFKNINRT